MKEEKEKKKDIGAKVQGLHFVHHYVAKTQ